MEEHQSRRDRLKGKLFGNKDKSAEKERDKKYMVEQSANDISAFLGNSDRLQISHPPPPPPSQGHREYDRQQPMLALDVSRATRYPTALEVDNGSHQNLPYRTRSHSPPRRRGKGKGLTVRFADTFPEVIGEGGDECQTITAEISQRRRSKSAPTAAPIPPTQQGHEYARQAGAFQGARPTTDDGFTPSPIRRTQTGFSSISEPEPAPQQPRTVPPGEAVRTRFLDSSDRKDEHRRSFLEIRQQEQREAEGMAFAKALQADDPEDFDEHAQSSSPEPVRSTPPKIQRKDVAPQAMRGLTQESIPAAMRPSQIQTQPAWDQGPHQSRSLATHNEVPQMFQDPSQPPAPNRNPARRSPLPPLAINNTEFDSRGYDPDTRGYPPPKRSPLPPVSNRETPPVTREASIRSQRTTSPDELRINTEHDRASPASVYSGSIYAASDISYKDTAAGQNPRDRGYSTGSPEKSSRRPRDLAASPQEDAYQEFINRTKHLYELFRLHAEQFKPLSSSRPEDLCRAALWWFLKGRTALENAIRSRTRSTDPDDPKTFMARYQAYTDLTKGHWLAEHALPEIAENKFDPAEGDVGEVRQALKGNLMKLAGSMMRNDFLPPEEAFMPQMMEKAIWVEYPTVSQDLVSLLNGNWGSVLSANNQTVRTVSPLEALPLGDTSSSFNYGRVHTDLYLMEQGVESSQTYFPCVLSINRQTQDPNLMFTIASQNGSVTLQIKAEKGNGPAWENVRWRAETNSLELKLPRGFMVAMQCSQQDFRMLWSIFDFGSKVQSYLYPRKDETVAFHTQLVGFHYFDSDPKARTFPKEPVGPCEVGLYERILKEDSPTGRRSFHRGFRVAVVTGSRTRTLSGVSHFFTPQMPIQFAYLRGEQREPMLQIAYSDGKEKCRMVLSFSTSDEREKFLALLKGSYVHHDEELAAEVALQGFSMTEGLNDQKGGFQALQRLPWQLARIVNEKYHAGSNPSAVLAEKLRIEISSMDNKGICVGTVVDRVNMAPGEFKIRLGTKDILQLQVLRNPQEDLTISILDRPGLADAPRELSQLQSQTCKTSTIRTYRFSSFKDLHAFQTGVTGFQVLYDGIVSSLNISRRRMVVPVYKKWESGTARIQVVQQESSVQLLAFFEGWHHGHCMGFVLKGTDVFESVGRGGKAGLKLVDAKFPLPKVPAEEGAQADDLAFLCLDMPDYAGEHDDISIMFDDEGERDKLCYVLPAAVKGSRLSKIGRLGAGSS